ncbi:unnamed protein product [Caenorhabditis auriculariae]|uniref:NR LBD domain-containing protein n=1 Tax=Caenorhabditis auriculariae TaxID=2777116 RepID=A0A8S1GV83_9PELO|nr:unnamed protein product [Caenorhabditis auriculariae]
MARHTTHAAREHLLSSSSHLQEVVGIRFPSHENHYTVSKACQALEESKSAKISHGEAYLAAISQPAASRHSLDDFEEIVSRLKTVLLNINHIRKLPLPYENFDSALNEILSQNSACESLLQIEEIEKERVCKREMPEWLTIDLWCAIEFARSLPYFADFDLDIQELFVRRSAFELAIAMQAMDSYLKGLSTVTFPDSSTVFDRFPHASNDLHYEQMFVRILEPFYREKFCLEELLLMLYLMFYSIDEFYFPMRYGKLQALMEFSISSANRHRQKMMAADSIRQKNCDLLIEQIVFGYQVS